MNITPNERAVLDALATNHFGQDVGDLVWANCINDADRPSGIEGKALSGVCASLSRKELISCEGYGDDACVSLTTRGVLALALTAD